MKKTIFATISIFLAAALFVACSDDKDDDRRVEFSTIPVSAKAFITENFDDFDPSLIAYVELDSDGTYDVKFKNGIEIDFYADGVWKEIDLNGNALPTSITRMIPENALLYISEHYPNGIIEEIEKTGKYVKGEAQAFKIELRGDRDIHFNALGEVVNDKGSSDGGREDVANKIPEKIQTFLNKYFEGQTPNKVEMAWNKYEIEYNKNTLNEIEIEFFKDESFKSVEVEGTNPIIRTIIEDVTASPKILKYIDAQHPTMRIEEFSMASSLVGENLKGGYVVELDGKPNDLKIYFNAQSDPIATVKD